MRQPSRLYKPNLEVGHREHIPWGAGSMLVEAACMDHMLALQCGTWASWVEVVAHAVCKLHSCGHTHSLMHGDARGVVTEFVEALV